MWFFVWSEVTTYHIFILWINSILQVTIVKIITLRQVIKCNKFFSGCKCINLELKCSVSKICSVSFLNNVHHIQTTSSPTIKGNQWPRNNGGCRRVQMQLIIACAEKQLCMFIFDSTYHLSLTNDCPLTQGSIYIYI